MVTQRSKVDGQHGGAGAIGSVDGGEGGPFYQIGVGADAADKGCVGVSGAAGDGRTALTQGFPRAGGVSARGGITRGVVQVTVGDGEAGKLGIVIPRAIATGCTKIS